MRNVFPEYKSDVILGNGELQLDPMSYNVFYKKREINLSPREFEVLYLLAQRPNWVIPKKNIYCSVWLMLSVRKMIRCNSYPHHRLRPLRSVCLHQIQDNNSFCFPPFFW